MKELTLNALNNLSLLRGYKASPLSVRKTPLLQPKVSKSVVSKSSPVVPVSPSLRYEDIAKRAYEIYIAYGRQEGYEKRDWYQAEKELRG